MPQFRHLKALFDDSRDGRMYQRMKRQRDKARCKVAILQNRLRSLKMDLGMSSEVDEPFFAGGASSDSSYGTDSAEDSIISRSEPGSENCLNCEQNLFCFDAMFKACKSIFEPGALDG